MNNIEKIKEILANNNDILLIKDLEKHNIHRQYVKKLVDEDYLEKVSKGIYVKKGKSVNEFFILGRKYQKGVFSHNTALYFYNMTDRTPLQLDLTFPSNVGVHDDTIKIHYIKNNLLTLGMEDMKLQDGTTIKIYNMERTICDIVRDRNKIDPQIFNDALKEYMKKKNKNFLRLYKYAKEFHIENILAQYMEVL